jgi:hypothetical protein
MLFTGRAGISSEFPELAGFDRADMDKELTLLESLGHVAFVDITLRTPSGKPAEPLARL